MCAAETFALRRILCPTDFSEHSAAAVGVAVELARLGHGQVRVLHVAPLVLPAGAFDLTCLPPRARGELLEELRRCARPAEAAGVQVECLLREGDPADEVLRELESNRPDLVVMDRNIRGSVDRWILGSVTERVVRHAAVPVLLVPPGFSLAAAGGPARVLCAVRLDDISKGTVAHAARLASVLRAELVVLHVVDGLEREPWGGRSPVDVAEYRRIMAQEASEQLDALAPDALHPEGRVERRLATGVSHAQILDAARSIGAAFVVMGSHRHKLALGSTVRHVLRRSACPVLVAPSRASLAAERTDEEREAAQKA